VLLAAFVLEDEIERPLLAGNRLLVVEILCLALDGDLPGNWVALRFGLGRCVGEHLYVQGGTLDFVVVPARVFEGKLLEKLAALLVLCEHERANLVRLALP